VGGLKRVVGATFTGLFALVVAMPTRALAQPQQATNFVRSHFTAEDGLGSNVVDDISQTEDGFLWLITNGLNLVRFDGTTFFRFRRTLTTLAAAPGGDLWLGTRESLIEVRRRDLSQFTFSDVMVHHPRPGPETVVTRVRAGRNGVLWVGTNGGLFRFDGGRFVALGPRVGIREIEETPEGHLLLITEIGFVELDAGSKGQGYAVVAHPELAERLGVTDADVLHVLRDRRGNTWYSTKFGLARETNGRIEKLGTFGPHGHAATRTYEGTDGTIWAAKEEGLFRAAAGGLEPMAPGLQVRGLFCDRDGNLWVGTNGDGLYRFKPSAIRMFTKADGLPNDVIQTVMTSRDGTLWVGANCGGVARFDGRSFHTYNEQNGLLNSCVYALAEDAHRDLWVGTWGGGVFRFHDGAFTQFSKKEGMNDDRVTSIVAARDGTMWFGTRSGANRLKRGQIQNFKVSEGLSPVAALGLVEDREGVLWAGSRNGLYRFAGDHFESFPPASKSTIIAIGDDPDGGFVVQDDLRTTIVRLVKDHAYDIAGLSAYDMIATPQGDLWFGGDTIGRVSRGEFARARASDEPLDHETFSVADGLAQPDATGIQRSVALTPDGKIWVATAKGLAMFDLHRMSTATTKPSIYITNVTIGRKTTRPERELVLPAGTNHLQIDFGAVEISSPEKVLMQYRLDDVDSEWLDAGRERRAIYSTLPPGTHTLRIRASNRSGIWDRQGVVFSIKQRPFFYQTSWFVVALGVSGTLFVIGLYRLRVRQMSRVMSARFDERLAERTRVARELHDTLLQTVQGSKLVADHALKDRADHARLVRALEQLSTWLAQGVEEGRAALNSLRTSTTETNDLAEALRRAADESRARTDAEISVTTSGESRQLHPMVRDEIYRIGYEAIRNACLHSRGDCVAVTLEYGRDLTLSVRDNGVGFDAGVAEQGKAGHFGLPGMKERAARIGGTLTLVSGRGSGTAVTLVVPGRVAYRKVRTAPTRNGG